MLLQPLTHFCAMYIARGIFRFSKQCLSGLYNIQEQADWMAVNQKTFNEVKNALRKTLHILIDLDFEDGKLDEAIKSFLDAEKMQINLRFHLNPNDVIFVRNLTNDRVPQKILDRVKKLRRGQS